MHVYDKFLHVSDLSDENGEFKMRSIARELPRGVEMSVLKLF